MFGHDEYYTDDDEEQPAGDKMCEECGRPLPLDALLDGSTLCSPECVDDYYYDPSPDAE